MKYTIRTYFTPQLHTYSQWQVIRKCVLAGVVMYVRTYVHTVHVNVVVVSTLTAEDSPNAVSLSSFCEPDEKLQS